MADFHIGLDFGTSQTKVCLLNKNSDVRDFLKFGNNSYFLPSLIVKKDDNTFSYGDENATGTKYRYFKMSAAEDIDLIKATNENLEGNLPNGNIDDYRKYSTNSDIKPEILVVLYLTYIYSYVKKTKSTQLTPNVGGLLGRLAGNNTVTENTYSINLGIPTEWNNPNHIKRKIKFQSLLLTAVELSNQFENLEQFLSANESGILNRITVINQNHLRELLDKDDDKKNELIKTLLQNQKLSVFPESAAGINYLLKTNRLANGSYATLDIGAGTSDIAIFEVNNNALIRYYCSESVAIASNDFFREYAKQYYEKENISFNEIKEIETIIQNDNELNENFYRNARNTVKGFLNSEGIEFAIRKTFYRKFYIPLCNANKVRAFKSKNGLNGKLVIVFGGGAKLEGFSSGNYCFYLDGGDPLGNRNCNFTARPITNYVNQVDISEDNNDIQNYISLLILALGLTYGEQNGGNIPFDMPPPDPEVQPDTPPFDRYFYYDLQEAAYK